MIALGAPELPDGSALSGWNALITWSTEQAEIRATALPAAQEAAEASTQHRDEIVTLLEIEFDALDVLLPEGEITSTAPVRPRLRSARLGPTAHGLSNAGSRRPG